LTRSSPPNRSEQRWPFALAGSGSLLWVAGLAAYAFSLGPGAATAANVTVLIVLAVAPLGFVWAAAVAVAQATILIAEARRAKLLTDQMLGPAAHAAVETGTIVEAVRAQILTASQVAAEARERLAALREALALETE